MPKRRIQKKSVPEPQTILKRDIDTQENKDRHDALQRQAQAQRRQKVAMLYHAGKTQEEIADLLTIAQSTVSEDLSFLRKQWITQATEFVGDWVARELSYAVEQRASAMARWQTNYDPRYAEIILKWTKRIADLLGLDAPDKVDDWTDKDWRAYAQANGLNEQDAIAEAERIISTAKAGAALSTASHPAATDTAATSPSESTAAQ